MCKCSLLSLSGFPAYSHPIHIESPSGLYWIMPKPDQAVPLQTQASVLSSLHLRTFQCPLCTLCTVQILVTLSVSSQHPPDFRTLSESQKFLWILLNRLLIPTRWLVSERVKSRESLCKQHLLSLSGFVFCLPVPTPTCPSSNYNS